MKIGPKSIGRPTKPRSERRSFVVMCCLNREEHRALELALKGRSKSEFMRTAVMRSAKG